MPIRKTSAEQFVFEKQAFRITTPGEGSVRIVFLNFVFSHSSAIFEIFIMAIYNFYSKNKGMKEGQELL